MYKMAAGAIGAHAVGAQARDIAGGLGRREALHHAGGGVAAHTAVSGVHIRHHLVHPGHHNDLLGAKAEGGYPIAVAVDVKKLTVGGDSIGGGQEGIRQEALTHQLLPLLTGLGSVPVDELLAPGPQKILEAQLVYGEGAAPGNRILRGDQLQHLFYRRGPVGAIIGLKMALVQGLGHLGPGLIILHFSGCQHYRVLLPYFKCWIAAIISRPAAGQ